MSAAKAYRLGKLPPRYKFILNPYPDLGIWRCPWCNTKTGQRKVPLLIHIDPLHPVALNYTCRFCPRCDLLIAHKHQIEHLLFSMFSCYDSSVIGNDYLILGTMEKSAWREGMEKPIEVADMPAYTHDFKAYYKELRMSRPGWYPKDQEPPIEEPPASEEWVKREHAHGRSERKS